MIARGLSGRFNAWRAAGGRTITSSLPVIILVSVVAALAPQMCRGEGGIAPGLLWSHVLARFGDDLVVAMAPDPSGGVWIAGYTPRDIPWDGVSAHKIGPGGSNDAYVARIDESGQLHTFVMLGGSGDDRANSVAIAPDGNVVLVGDTRSGDFPVTEGIVQPALKGSNDAFVVKLGPDGQLLWATFLGGTDDRWETAYGVATGADGAVVVCGGTDAADFPSVRPLSEQRTGTAGMPDAFVAVLSPDGTSVGFSTRLGGSSVDGARAVAVADSGHITVAGTTWSTDFPVLNAVQPSLGDQQSECPGDAFVARIDIAASRLLYSTYLGASDAEQLGSIAADTSGAVYVALISSSADYPITTGPPRNPHDGLFHAFTAKLAADGRQVLFSRWLAHVTTPTGGPSAVGCREVTERPQVMVDQADRAWVAGMTLGTTLPVLDAFQPTSGGDHDGFLTVLGGTTGALLASSYLGGVASDVIKAVVVGSQGDVYVAGHTSSHNFPGSQGQALEGIDAFVARLTVQQATLAVTASASPTSGLAPLAVSFTAAPTGGTGIYTFDWDFGDGSPSSTEQHPTHTYAAGGSYTARFTVTDSAAAAASATVTIEVQASCYLSCTASAPLAASVLATSGLAPVPFAGSASVSPDCPTSPSFAWSFGDGQESAEEDPLHVYPAPGAYDWTMTASAAGRVCTQRGTVVVTQLGDVETLRIIPAVAHNDGFLGSKWRTDLALVNASSQPAGLSLVFFGADGPIVRTAALAGGASREWHDLLVSLFGLADDAVARGTVQLAADAPIALAARTYNLSPSGTYGQTFPALALGEGVASGQGGLIAGLKKTSTFRTNLGVVNTSTQESTVRIGLHDAAGAALGSPLTVTVPAGRWIQIDDVFAAAGAPETELASAGIEVLNPNTSAWAYAAVIDNATGDPTTVPVTVP